MTERANGASVAVALGEDELLGLQVLAGLDGVPESDPEGFTHVLRHALRLGIAGRFEAAGLPWPPTPDALRTVDGTGAERTGAETADDQAPPGPRSHTLRNVTIGALVVATIVVIIGGYAGHWSWTGFDANGQVWDWMHLLLLPVAFGLFGIWLRHAGHMSPARRRAFGVALVVFVGFVAAGYLAPLVWSGFKGQKLWDWLTLIVLPATIIAIRAWPTTGRSLRRVHGVVGGALLAGLIVTMIGGYAGGWTWTGYQGNKLWEWLQLLLAPIAIGTILMPQLLKVLSGHAEDRARAEKAHKEQEEKALSATRDRATGIVG